MEVKTGRVAHFERAVSLKCIFLLIMLAFNFSIISRQYSRRCTEEVQDAKQTTLIPHF